MCIPRFKASNFHINLTYRNKIHHGKINFCKKKKKPMEMSLILTEKI